MPRRNRSQSQAVAQPPSGPTIWLRADYEFPSTFSYRMPDVSPQFAIGSPVPSPAAVKLALADAAIRCSGKVAEGRRIFELVKNSKVSVCPPRRIVRFRAFIKRLKPDEVMVCKKHPSHKVSAKLEKDKREPCPHCGKTPDEKVAVLTGSTGIRDYFIYDGALSVYIQVPQSQSQEIADLLKKIRRLGTTDSLCWCSNVSEESPPETLCSVVFWHSVQGHGKSAKSIPLGWVARLKDLTTSSSFEGFSPFDGAPKRSNLCEEVHVLPLTMQRSGETWAILIRSDQESSGLESP